MSDRWAGLPRTKSTARPERGLYRLIGAIARGDIKADIVRRNGMVTIQAEGHYAALPESYYDRIANPSDVKMNINVYTPIPTGD